MLKHKYILEPYKGMNTRYRCPSCQQRDKTFSLYIDAETGEHIHPTVGRCNRESNCGHHYTPKQYFQDNNISFDTPQPKAYKPRPVKPQPKPVSFIPVEVFKASLNPTAFETNHFVQFLINLFGFEVSSQLVSRYFIATSKHWNGATVFWQIDTQGKVRTGKIMLYSPTTGKRVKEPFNHINWVHTALKQPEFELKQCFFGEHLINQDLSKPIAIVESEKTAVIAGVYLPQFTWLAVGSLKNLNAEKCSILKGRKVILFPDLRGFEKWTEKAKELSHITTFTVSDLLERKATELEKKQGLDLADYLIRFSWKSFFESAPIIEGMNSCSLFSTKTTIIQRRDKEFRNLKEENSIVKIIEELENFFKTKTLSYQQPIRINQYMMVTDIQLFIDSHLAAIKTHKDSRTFLPYLNRLQNLKIFLVGNPIMS